MDLKNIDLKNLNIEDIKKKILQFTDKKTLIKIGISAGAIIIFLIIYYSILIPLVNKKKIQLAEKYNSISNKFISNNQANIKKDLIEIIYEKDTTYSPLALYFIIDNNIKTTNEEINEYFDILINDLRLDKEIKNLIIYKKALFNSDFETENNLIAILNPLINSESVWKSHALYLMAEYFFEKNQNQKAKEFFNQILSDKNSNENIIKEANKRLSRDLSE